MTQPYPKRLIEVDLPIARISAHARREKSIRHGHISTLHIWWARRPLAACRAVICASLWPDPADPLCPQAFRKAAAKHLVAFACRVFPKMITEEKAHLQETASEASLVRWKVFAKNNPPLDPADADHQNILRFALLDFIADFANWDNSTVPAYLETARALTQAAHEALGGEKGTRPLVADPFAGGGSIPLEALRVGADAFASDLNPVAVLLNKVVLEYIPKYGQKLADEVRKWGQWVKEQAEKELNAFYPKDADGSTPIAYLWARTARCEGPMCGVEVPLLRATALSERDPIAHLLVEKTADSRAVVTVREGKQATSTATVRSGKLTCPCCNYTTPDKRIKEQMLSQHGGADQARLLSVLVQSSGSKRIFRGPTDADLQTVASAKKWISGLDTKSGILPDELINPLRPYKNTVGVCIVTRIGIKRFRDLYSSRQLAAILVFQKTIQRVGQLSHPDRSFKTSLLTLLHFVLDRMVMQNSSLSRWNPIRSTIEGLFSKQALQIVWDYVEANPCGPGMANWDGAVEWVTRVIEHNVSLVNTGVAVRSPAADCPIPHESVDFFFTDPPYFAAIPYADLSDVFYVWMRRGLADIAPGLFDSDLTEKTNELVVTNSAKGPDGRVKDASFFVDGMTSALRTAKNLTKPHGLSCLVFADASTTAWESMLSAVINGGWVMTSSWAIDTERQGRTRALGSASLQSSIFMVCRPRESDLTGEWRQVLSELPKRMHEWMPRLASEGVVGADAIFACLGPALEIFSRYSGVEKANGDPVTLKEYLEHVWAAVSKEALSTIFRDADASGLEPDARITAMWLWTIGGGVESGARNAESEESEVEDTDDEETGKNKSVKSAGFALEFDAARKIAQGLGIHLEKSESIVEIKGDKARLLAVSERTKHLFGKESKEPAAAPKKRGKPVNPGLFDNPKDVKTGEEAPVVELMAPTPGSTVLDRLHQAMILFGAQRGELLKRFLVEDGVGKDARFWKLAQSLAALYPPGTDERRWVEGVLARKKSLGQ
ncbi:MAG: DUF1156 domain-containing protein [Planctomycetes bacterium]|nr:DUF1156 domain-containing protein [Planctomycetota bacterium]